MITSNKNFYLAISAILLAIMGFTVLMVRDSHRQDNAKFTELVNRTYELSFADEQLISDCKTAKTNPALIHNDVGQVTRALENQVKAIYAAGKLISPETFCKLLAYNMINNDIIYSGGNVCDSKVLISEEQNFIYKGELLTRINNDNLASHRVCK